MSSRDPELSDILAAFRADLEFEMRVCMPAIVVKYDAAKRLADVQPCQKITYVNKPQPENLPIIPNCPVVFPSGGGYAMTWPLLPNDSCILVFADRSIDEWIDKGGIYDPKDGRRHNLSDAFVIPGGAPTSTAIPADAAKLIVGTTSGTAKVEIDPTGNVTVDGVMISIGQGAVDPAVLGNALLTYLNSHTHTAPAGVAGGPTTPPIVPATAAILSTKVKVK